MRRKTANECRFVKVQEVQKLTSLGRTTLWKLEREGKFPKGFHIAGLRGAKGLA